LTPRIFFHLPVMIFGPDDGVSIWSQRSKCILEFILFHDIYAIAHRRSDTRYPFSLLRALADRDTGAFGDLFGLSYCIIPWSGWLSLIGWRLVLPTSVLGGSGPSLMRTAYCELLFISSCFLVSSHSLASVARVLFQSSNSAWRPLASRSVISVRLTSLPLRPWLLSPCSELYIRHTDHTNISTLILRTGTNLRLVSKLSPPLSNLATVHPAALVPTRHPRGTSPTPCYRTPSATLRLNAPLIGLFLASRDPRTTISLGSRLYDYPPSCQQSTAPL
jgi:hypothetical protein